MNLHPSELLERHIENRLVREVKKHGGIPYKFKSPQRRSVPDRLCVFRHNQIWFIECKRPGEVPTPNQHKELMLLKKQGCNATYVDTYEKINLLIQYIQQRLKFLDEILS